MFQSKYIFTFILVTFFMLSITGAGIFVDDEWASAQQLRQLGEGHQIVTNEGAYGYYANGTSGDYFAFRENRMMYTMALPIASLPIYEIMKLSRDHFRIFYLMIWSILGILLFVFLYQMRKLSTKQMSIGIGIIFLLTLLNICLYTDFPINGKFIPSEVLAIVSTNIILFGLFTVILHKIIDRLFDNERLKLFAFITILSCTSLIFWVGACKDHILTTLIALVILYYLIKYEQQKSMTALSIGLFLTGLLTWVRIELGVGMAIGIFCYLLIFNYKHTMSNKWTLIVSFLTGTIPLWINNYITTGSPFIHPFTVALSQFGSQEAANEMTAIMMGAGWSNPIRSLFDLLFSPSSGAVGLLIVIPLVIIIIPAYLLKRVKLSQTDILLLFIAFTSSMYYIGKSALYMPFDTGIMPDMRYFIFFYTVITLFILSVLSKIIPTLPYKKMIIYFILITGLLFILFTTYSAAVSGTGTYRDLDRIVNTLATIVMGIGLIAVINDIRLNKNYLTYIIPIMIAIPMAWQLVMLFIYHTSEAHSYPMFIPITEYIYNNIFGLIK